MKKLTRIVSLFLVFAMAVFIFRWIPVKALVISSKKRYPMEPTCSGKGCITTSLRRCRETTEGPVSREGALLMITWLRIWLYTDSGIPADRCVYISLDELARGRRREPGMPIYSVAVGTRRRADGRPL